MMSVTEIQDRLETQSLPTWEKELGEPLTEKLRQVVRLLEVIRIEDHVEAPRRQGRGRFPHDRRLLARAFVVKAIYNAPTTQHLLEMLQTQPMLRRICGWTRRSDVPSAATFSRAFAGFAQANLGETVHQALIAKYIGDRLVGHICRDATEIDAREKPAKKPPPPPKLPRKRGRPKKGEERPAPEPTRLWKQTTQTAEEAFSEVPTACDRGCKRDADGHSHRWIGYKAHIDTADGGLPVTVVTTSASLHDSQVAIPMARRTAERVTSLYDLMDAAYDAQAIYRVSEGLGHRPIIDKNGRGKEVPPLTRRPPEGIINAASANGLMLGSKMSLADDRRGSEAMPKSIFTLCSASSLFSPINFSISSNPDF